MHALLLLALFAADEPSPEPGPKKVKLASGLTYLELKEGKGPAAKNGDRLRVHYAGRLAKDGKPFDSTRGGTPFTFELGKGAVIKGWDEGLVGVKPGGKRKLLIPAKLAYGERGVGPIPPNADLIFDVELVSIEK